MLLGGVWVDNHLVRRLAAVVDSRLARRLEEALLFRSEAVGLTTEERKAVLGAAASSPELAELREALLADRRWQLEQKLS